MKIVVAAFFLDNDDLELFATTFSFWNKYIFISVQILPSWNHEIKTYRLHFTYILTKNNNEDIVFMLI